MSMLSALVAEDTSACATETPPSPAQRAEEFRLNVEELLKTQPLTSTSLGDSVNNVKVYWNQLLSHVFTEGGNIQPTHDHIKELAEYSVKQLKESCLEVIKEFHKSSLEWRLENPEQAIREEIADYKAAIERQKAILNSTEEKFQKTLERYKNVSK